MRLDKFLADMGAGTRSEIKKNIRGGAVLVGGEPVRDPGFLLDETAAPEVTYFGKPVEYHIFEYYMMNKPAGVLTATVDKRQKTVLDLMADDGQGGRRRRDLAPVGRLDKDTEGLLLLSNDGQLAHRLLAPASHVDKTYYAELTAPVTQEDIEKFQRGIQFDRNLTAMPANMEIVSGDASKVRITIQEGKFHQIKKMVAALGGGREVKYLQRITFGPLRLDPDLSPEEYRKLTEKEIQELRARLLRPAAPAPL